MSNLKRQNLAKALTAIVMFLTLFQGLIPTMPISGTTLTIVSSVAMFLVTALTAWKQYVSNLIRNSAINATLFAAIVATLMGVGDLLDMFNFSSSTSQWVRFAITLIVAFVNFYSQQMFPEREGNFWLLKDTNTNQYVTYYTLNPVSFTLGAKEDAIVFTEENAISIARTLGGGAIVPVKGF